MTAERGAFFFFAPTSANVNLDCQPQGIHELRNGSPGVLAQVVALEDDPFRDAEFRPGGVAEPRPTSLPEFVEQFSMRVRSQLKTPDVHRPFQLEPVSIPVSGIAVDPPQIHPVSIAQKPAVR